MRIESKRNAVLIAITIAIFGLMNTLSYGLGSKPSLENPTQMETPEKSMLYINNQLAGEAREPYPLQTAVFASSKGGEGKGGKTELSVGGGLSTQNQIMVSRYGFDPLLSVKELVFTNGGKAVSSAASLMWEPDADRKEYKGTQTLMIKGDKIKSKEIEVKMIQNNENNTIKVVISNKK